MPQANHDKEAETALAKVVVGRDAADMKKYGTIGTMYIGKHLVGTGEDAHVTTPVLLDALRPHIIVLCGKRGEGKCLMPETPVLLADGTVKEIHQIFKDSAPNADWEKTEELFPCNQPLLVLSLNNKLEIMPKPISHVYRKKVKEKLIRITTKHGRELVCTREHPLLTIEDDLMWRMASELYDERQNKIAACTAGSNTSGESAQSASDSSARAIGTLQTTLQSSGGQILKQYIMSWDEINKVEEVDYEGFVYDLTVPDTHNFVAASTDGRSGIICHNSYSMGVLTEELQRLPEQIKNNLCALMIDTQGIFWTMKSPNEKDLPLLAEWGMRPKGFTTFVYVPEGQETLFTKAAVMFDGVFSVAASELTSEDWLAVFELDPNQPLGILMQRTINRLKRTAKEYTLDDIVEAIRQEKGFEAEKLALENRFDAAKGWGIFGAARMPTILEPGKLSIIDISLTPQNVRALLIAMVSRKLFEERTVARRKEELAETEGRPIKRTPMCWLLIDEAHNFIPDEGHPASMETLLKIVREGRQPGITLVLATQRPEKLHPDALAQTDMLISHRLTAKPDIDALKRIMQTYLIFPIEKYMNELPKLKGVAIILDDNSERLYTVRIRPRQSWHAGASPAAI